jgi:transglutaminase-like putative cysteine protease
MYWMRTWLLLGLFLVPAAGSAAPFPPIAEAEKALKSVPGQPGAPGVILYRKALLNFRDYSREANSRMEVQARLKVLTEEGKNLGEVEVAHSRQLRLDNFEGRIVRPDGSEQALPKEAIFVERRSRSRKAFVTRAAFPNVEVGSILDYRYTLYWDDFFYLEPWYFHDELPILHSEVIYEVPASLAVQVWGKETSGAKIQSEKQQRQKGTTFKVWMDNLPGLPNEPFSFPREDLSSRFVLIPTHLYLSGEPTPLLESWKQLSITMLDQIYKGYLGGDRLAGLEAKRLAAVAGKERRAQIRALYEFVRDEVRTTDSTGVWIRDGKADQVLENRAGSASEKSLLLYTMLDALKIPARILWVANRRDGRAELEVPNPTWFEAVVLQVEDGGETLSLDPSDRSLALGRLPPHYENTGALVVDRKKPEAVILPASPYSANLQKATLNLEVDAEGKLAGSGELALAGHYAWRWLRAKETPEETAKLWLDKLADLFPGFEPSAVTVAENLAEQRLLVGFKLDQRAENVLGDEVGLQPSRPFVATQPLTLPPEQRLTPVMLPFAAVDETHLTLTWDPAFEIDALPKDASLETPLGTYSLAVKADPAARKAEVVRSFGRHKLEIHGQDNYAVLRKLYEKASQSDAQTLVLVRP